MSSVIIPSVIMSSVVALTVVAPTLTSSLEKPGFISFYFDCPEQYGCSTLMCPVTFKYVTRTKIERNTLAYC
jgi:hypothetical protein